MFGLKVIFLLIGCLMLLTHGTKEEIIYNGTVNATLGGSIMLPCIYSLRKPFDMSKMIVYWQRNSSNKDDVLLTHYKERKLDYTYQSHTYKNRVHVFTEQLATGNFNLTLSLVRASDKGIYRTVIYNDMSGNRVECRNEVNVGVSFSKPKVTIIGCDVPHRQALCKSQGGIPAPSVHWTIDNDTVDNENVKTRSWQDLVNATFSVESQLNFSNIKGLINCVIVNPTLPTNQSTTISITHCDDGRTNVTAVILSIVGVVLILVFLSYLIYNKGRRQESRCSQKQGNAAALDLEQQKLQANCTADNHALPND